MCAGFTCRSSGRCSDVASRWRSIAMCSSYRIPSKRISPSPRTSFSSPPSTCCGRLAGGMVRQTTRMGAAVESATMTHFDHVRRFLSDALGAESIDEAYPQLEGHRADYFAFDRRLIVELKNLEDDRQAGVQAVFDKWRHTFPPAYGTVM